MSGLHLPPAEPPADAILALRAQLDEARDELHEAQRIAALLEDEQEDQAARGHAVGIARLMIERDLAGRRVEAWSAILDRLRDEGRRRGVFLP